MRRLSDKSIQNSDTVGRLSLAQLEQSVVAVPCGRRCDGLQLTEGLLQRDHGSVVEAVASDRAYRRSAQTLQLASQPGSVCPHAGVARPGLTVVIRYGSVELSNPGVVLVDGLPAARLSLAKLALELRSADSTGHMATVAPT